MTHTTAREDRMTYKARRKAERDALLPMIKPVVEEEIRLARETAERRIETYREQGILGYGYGQTSRAQILAPTYFTVGQMTAYVRQHGITKEHTPTYTLDDGSEDWTWFGLLSKRDQWLVVSRALEQLRREGKVERLLGINGNNQEAREYGWKGAP